MSDLCVFGIGTARTFRVHWALEELGLDYETREILPRTEGMQDPELLAASERGKVPILRAGDQAIGESAAIVTWLADTYRDGPVLSPEPGSRERGAYLDLCSYAQSELDAPLYTIRLHGGLPEVYGEAPAAVETARAYFARMVGEIDRRLSDERPCLLGDAFTGADILVGSCLDWARILAIPMAKPLADYRERLAARPAYMAATATNFTPEARAHIAGKTGAPG